MNVRCCACAMRTASEPPPWLRWRTCMPSNKTYSNARWRRLSLLTKGSRFVLTYTICCVRIWRQKNAQLERHHQSVVIHTYIHKLAFFHGSRQKPQNAFCYDPYILLMPRPRSYIGSYKHAGYEYCAPDLSEEPHQSVVMCCRNAIPCRFCMTIVNCDVTYLLNHCINYLLISKQLKFLN